MNKVENYEDLVFLAINCNNIISLLEVSSNLESLDFRDSRNVTPLVYAASKGLVEIVRFLLTNGASVDPYEEYDIYHSPLTIAASKGHFEIVRLLVESGSSMTLHVGPWQCIAECYARRNGHRRVSDYLQLPAVWSG